VEGWIKLEAAAQNRAGGRGRLGRLAAWHLPGGPIGPASRRTATSNVEVNQTTHAVNGRMVGRKGRKGSEGQSRKEEKREGGSGTEEGVQGPLAWEVGLYLDICAGHHEFLVTSLLMGPICLLSQGRCGEPVRSCRWPMFGSSQVSRCQGKPAEAQNEDERWLTVYTLLPGADQDNDSVEL